MFRHHKHKVYVNGTWFHDVLIDEHVFQRHEESIDDVLALQLVSLLHMQDFVTEAVDKKGSQYFVNDELILAERRYRLVWLVPPDNSYLGVRTAFRRNHGTEKV